MFNWLELKVPPVIIFALTVAAGWWCNQQMLLPMHTPMHTFGIILFVVGIFTGIAGVIEFRKHRTTVNPHKPHQSSTLVATGIFRYSRNPMYLGLVLCILSMAVYMGEYSIILLSVLMAGYLYRFQIKPEEQHMHLRFGEEFEIYRQRTGRWLGYRDK
jgi:protein-S-isoprenylcysteine O-methyltransferase Ste14